MALVGDYSAFYQPLGSYEAALGNPASNGQVLSSTTAGVRSWITPTGGGGVPGGANTQVQFNNSGAFGGSANLTWDNTNNILTLPKLVATNGGSAASLALELNYLGVTNAGITAMSAGWVDIISNGTEAISATNGWIGMPAGTQLYWTPGSNAHASADIAIARNSAGVLEINNSTAGQYRDLKLRTLLYPSAVQGSNTNDAAVAGNIGETVTTARNTSSGLTLTAATPANILSISLTAGDWDVRGSLQVCVGVGTGTSTQLSAAISQTSATITDDGYQAYGLITNSTAGTLTLYTNVPLTPRRVSLSATTTVYLVGQSSVTASAGGSGYLEARRIR